MLRTSSPLRRIVMRRALEMEARVGLALRSVGIELRRSSFYLPLPDAAHLPETLWSGPRPTPGLELRLDDGLRLTGAIGGYLTEFPTTFQVANGSYEYGDAHTLWAMLRHLKPRHLIELGSGASSHLISAAKAANEADGSPLQFTTYDPFPGWHSMGAVPGSVVHPIAAERLDPQVVDTLESGDVLFVDTTHTVKTGGDVAHIFLELLPRLKSGVYVHIHDIFLPYEYPRRWVKDLRFAWAEQYLLQAFLAFNEQFEVVLPVHALWRDRHDQLVQVIPDLAQIEGEGPGAFWIRRR